VNEFVELKRLADRDGRTQREVIMGLIAKADSDARARDERKARR
jgi:hypothetical protein